MARTFRFKFEIYFDKNGEWRWRLVANNKKIIADSGEGYESRYACRNAAKKLGEKALNADVEIVDESSRSKS